jgi:hypothetical protein
VKSEQHGMEILASMQFSGVLDAWTEALCLERHADGTITLSSRSHEVLAEDTAFWGEDGELHLPAEIHGEKVVGTEGDYVIGEKLLPHDDDAMITIDADEYEDALFWLEQRGWDRHQDFAAICATIRAALKETR